MRSLKGSSHVIAASWAVGLQDCSVIDPSAEEKGLARPSLQIQSVVEEPMFTSERTKNVSVSNLTPL